MEALSGFWAGICPTLCNVFSGINKLPKAVGQEF